MKTNLIIVLSVGFLFTSCKKEVAPPPEHLAGQWKLVAIFDVWGVVGNPGWYGLPAAETHTITFGKKGTVHRTDNWGGGLHTCSGKYTVSSSSAVTVTSSCDPSIEQFTISVLTKDTLITDHQGTEGIIRYKYAADR